MFISEIMIISAKIDGYSRNLLSCHFFQGDFYWACTSIIAETLDKLEDRATKSTKNFIKKLAELGNKKKL